MSGQALQRVHRQAALVGGDAGERGVEALRRRVGRRSPQARRGSRSAATMPASASCDCVPVSKRWPAGASSAGRTRSAGQQRGQVVADRRPGRGAGRRTCTASTASTSRPERRRGRCGGAARSGRRRPRRARRRRAPGRRCGARRASCRAAFEASVKATIFVRSLDRCPSSALEVERAVGRAQRHRVHRQLVVASAIAQPRRDVGVVVELRHDDLVARLQRARHGVREQEVERRHVRRRTRSRPAASR